MNSFLKRTSIVLMSSGAALAFALTSANAADPIIYEQPPVMMPAAMYDWSGFYAGIAGGYATGDADYSISIGDGGGSFDLDGAFIGGVVGMNVQHGNIVFGVEGDLFWSGIDGSAFAFDDDAIGVDINWMGSVRGRVGYAFDNIMPYVTAGVAFGDADIGVSGDLNASDSNLHIGWTAGIGAEVGLTQNVSASLEYRYTDLGSKSYDFGAGFETRGSGEFHTIGMAVKWRFR
jgi:outer membrane immunogenic protein